TIRGTDAQGAFAETTLVVNIQPVNDPPESASIPDVAVEEDASPVQVDLLSYFSDVDDAPHLLQFGIVHNSNPSLFSGLQFSSQGVLTLGFAPDQHGVALLTVQATDPHGDS